MTGSNIRLINNPYESWSQERTRKYMKITKYFNKTQTVLNELATDIPILDGLISSTEEEFLAIGEKLQKFHQQANEISNLSADVASRTSGDEMKLVIEGFNAVSIMVEGIGGSFAAESDMLSSILANLAQIRNPLVDFAKVVRNLNILGIFIQIEIARLGNAGTDFKTLSDNVRRLAALISTKTVSLIDKTDILIPALNNNISLIEDYKSQQEGQSRLVLDKITKDLEMISQRKDLSAATVLGISNKWRKTTASIGEIVQSMQFHDITRQRIEHTCDALKNLPSKISELKKEQTAWGRVSDLFKSDGKPSDNNSRGGSPAANLVANTCKLQSAQLRKAKADFADAIERIMENLKNIALYAGSISEETMQISGKKEGKEGSFILEMEQDVDQLSNAIGTFAQIKKDLSQAMKTMTKIAADMSGYMKEMEKISIEMQILALNASIHAAHIGDQGATLSTLADSIHTLAAETASMVVKIVSNLQEAVVNAERLEATADAESSEGTRQTAEIKNSLGQLLLPLKAIDAEIEALLPRIDASGKSLAFDIQDLLAGINIHHKIGADIERVEASLEKAVIKMKVKTAKNIVGDKSGLLEDLASQYTMHSERETHLFAAGIVPDQLSEVPASIKNGEVTMPEAKAVAGKGENLGDNVELF
jgi:methyl-accepting chemotaxis protein